MMMCWICNSPFLGQSPNAAQFLTKHTRLSDAGYLIRLLSVPDMCLQRVFTTEDIFQEQEWSPRLVVMFMAWYLVGQIFIAIE